LGAIPSTHVVFHELVYAGFDEVLYQFFLSPGGLCIALWRCNHTDDPILGIVDPQGRIPSSPASWRKPCPKVEIHSDPAMNFVDLKNVGI